MWTTRHFPAFPLYYSGKRPKIQAKIEFFSKTACEILCEYPVDKSWITFSKVDSFCSPDQPKNAKFRKVRKTRGNTHKPTKVIHIVEKEKNISTSIWKKSFCML